jgi:hypothetical protein
MLRSCPSLKHDDDVKKVITYVFRQLTNEQVGVKKLNIQPIREILVFMVFFFHQKKLNFSHQY